MQSRRTCVRCGLWVRLVIGAGLLIATGLVAPTKASAQGTLNFRIHPGSAAVPAGGMQDFSTWFCSNGFGADGMPGTGDDTCSAASSTSWQLFGPGTLSTQTGPTTTYHAPPGSTGGTASLAAFSSGQSASAHITLVPATGRLAFVESFTVNETNELEVFRPLPVEAEAICLAALLDASGLQEVLLRIGIPDRYRYQVVGVSLLPDANRGETPATIDIVDDTGGALDQADVVLAPEGPDRLRQVDEFVLLPENLGSLACTIPQRIGGLVFLRGEGGGHATARSGGLQDAFAEVFDVCDANTGSGTGMAPIPGAAALDGEVGASDEHEDPPAPPDAPPLPDPSIPQGCIEIPATCLQGALGPDPLPPPTEELPPSLQKLADEFVGCLAEFLGCLLQGEMSPETIPRELVCPAETDEDCVVCDDD